MVTKRSTPSDSRVFKVVSRCSGFLVGFARAVRKYEPPSLSGEETVDVVVFLMSIENPTPEVVAAVEGAVAWLRTVTITGQRVDAKKGPDGRLEKFLVPDANAPALWARFYELGTNRPLYLDRDSVFHYIFSEVGYERRSGYSYHGAWPVELLERDYPAWRAKYAPQH